MGEGAYALLGAVVGALLTGGVDLIKRHLEANRDAASTLAAVKAEVKVLCKMIRVRKYIEEFETGAAEFETLPPDSKVAPSVIDGGNFFEVYRSMLPHLGRLAPGIVERIVEFYAIVQSVEGDYNPQSPWVTDGPVDRDAYVALLRQDAEMLRRALQLGDELATVEPDRTLVVGE